MTTQPPHSRLQIHLSTAVLLMFVAGGLIWANVRESRFEVEPRPGITDRVRNMKILSDDDYYKKRVGEDWAGNVHRYHGFPFDAKDMSATVFVRMDGSLIGHEITGSGKVRWNTNATVLNVLAGIVILAIAAFISELAIRRRRSGA